MARSLDAKQNPIPYRRGKVIWEHIYEITLYADSETANFEKVLQVIKEIYENIDYVYIYHDKDIKEDGTPKKPHYHLLLVFPREKSIQKLSKELGIPLNLIEWKAYLNKAVQYLIHMNAPDKAQYDIDALEGNSNWFLAFLGGDFSANKVSEISILMDFVYKNKEKITYYDIFRYALEHNLLNVYNKYYFKIKDVYKEL